MKVEQRPREGAVKAKKSRMQSGGSGQQGGMRESHQPHDPHGDHSREQCEPGWVTRYWDTFAGLREGPEGPEYADFGAPIYVRMLGYDVAHPVRLVIDPDGDLRGWLPAAHSDLTWVDHHSVFHLRFPLGVRATVEAGRGRVVPLRVEQRTMTAVEEAYLATLGRERTSGSSRR